MIAMFLYNITDTYFISQLGEEVFAGFGLMSPIILFTIILFNATSSAVTIHIGKAFGANRISRIKKKLFVGFSIVLLLSIFFFILFNIFSSEIANSYSATYILKSHFLEYFNIWTWTLPFLSLIALLSFSLNSMKNSKLSTQIHIIGLFLNVILDYFFIFGFENIIPPMGLEGAAWATLISNIFHFFILLYVFYQKRLLSFKIELKYYKIYFSKIRKLAVPLALQGMIIPVGLYIFALYVSRNSVSEIAAWALYMKFDALIFIVAASANATLGILGSIYYGNKKYSYIPAVFTLSNRILFFWLAFLVSAAFFFGEIIGSLFLTNKETLSIFSLTIIFGFLAPLIDTISGNLSKTFTIFHNPYIGLSIIAFRISFAFIVFPYIFSIWFGFFGLYYGFIAGTFSSLIFSYALFKKFTPHFKYIKFNSLY